MKTALWPWLLLVFLMLARPLRASAKTPGTTPPATSSAQYVGSDTCLSCHEEVYKKQFEGTPHFQTVKNGHGCESCHGPGLEHVEGGGDKSKIVSFAALSRAASSRRCLECHGEDGPSAIPARRRT